MVLAIQTFLANFESPLLKPLRYFRRLLLTLRDTTRYGLTVLFRLLHSLVVAVFMQHSEPVFEAAHHFLQVQLTAN